MKKTTNQLVKEQLLSALDREDIASRFRRDSYFRPYQVQVRSNEDHHDFNDHAAGKSEGLLRLSEVFCKGAFK